MPSKCIDLACRRGSAFNQLRGTEADEDRSSKGRGAHSLDLYSLARVRMQGGAKKYANMSIKLRRREEREQIRMATEKMKHSLIFHVK